MDIYSGLKIVNRIAELDEERRQVFHEELEVFEDGKLTGFDQTRRAISDQYQELEQLEQYIEEERANLEELVIETKFFTTEQAIRNRDEAVEKIRQRNQELSRYHDAVISGLKAVEHNLDALERGDEQLPRNAERHFSEAADAIKTHNEHTEGLEKNMAILSAYLP